MSRRTGTNIVDWSSWGLLFPTRCGRERGTACNAHIMDRAEYGPVKGMSLFSIFPFLFIFKKISKIFIFFKSTRKLFKLKVYQNKVL
jgi:hypothetical protein